ncbi:MAG TPA: 5-formyltetrahydrofolate cyclo-ligase [Steroidobacteraceae bacterium]|nr:5-formyltetrahydrofolate cyclo-ligase [Steroidobacteraceae bacterium]
MGGSSDLDDDEGGSSPCFLHELGPDGAPLDRQQARDVARWRKAERQRLIALRCALPAEERALHTAAIGRALDAMIPAGTQEIVSVYWPIRAEPDLRPWMQAACLRGLRIALPVAEELGKPLTFREWRPGARMARGLWSIPYPADGAELSPTTCLAPLVGFDAECYRLGYGGGFFDRTLAALARKPLAIGVGYPQLRIPTIFPQCHDVPMSWILAGNDPPQSRQ